MAKNRLPVYGIEEFLQTCKDPNFYINSAAVHVKRFDFILKPHKHDHYFVVFCECGTGIHDVDFTKYNVKPGMVFMLSPGQCHSWNLASDVEGYVLLHTKNFYDLNFSKKSLKEFPFYSSVQNLPFIQLEAKNLDKVKGIFEEIIEESKQNYVLKKETLCSLVDLLYIHLSRLYLPQNKTTNLKQDYLFKLTKLEDHIDLHFKTVKLPAKYAEMMHMSLKHLNRICKSTLNKTVSELIVERNILEARRLLSSSLYTIEEVANELGYFDQSYFTRLFKKKTGNTPKVFIQQYNS